MHENPFSYGEAVSGGYFILSTVDKDVGDDVIKAKVLKVGNFK